MVVVSWYESLCNFCRSYEYVTCTKGRNERIAAEMRLPLWMPSGSSVRVDFDNDEDDFPRVSKEELSAAGLDGSSSWSLDEIIYLLRLAREYNCSWYAMADAYSYTGAGLKRPANELKEKMAEIYEKIPSFSSFRLDNDRMASEVIEIGMELDASLQTVIDSRRKLFSKYAGDLLEVPQRLQSSSLLPFWPFPSSEEKLPHAAGIRKISKKHKKAPIDSSSLLEIKSNGLPSTRLSQFTTRVQNNSSLRKHGTTKAVATKTNFENGPSVYLRSQRLKTIRIGIAKPVERLFAEHKLTLKPLFASGRVCALHDEVKTLLMALYDERKAAEKVHSVNKF